MSHLLDRIEELRILSGISRNERYISEISASVRDKLKKRGHSDSGDDYRRNEVENELGIKGKSPKEVAYLLVLNAGYLDVRKDLEAVIKKLKKSREEVIADVFDRRFTELTKLRKQRVKDLDLKSEMNKLRQAASALGAIPILFKMAKKHTPSQEDIFYLVKNPLKEFIKLHEANHKNWNVEEVLDALESNRRQFNNDADFVKAQIQKLMPAINQADRVTRADAYYRLDDLRRKTYNQEVVNLLTDALRTILRLQQAGKMASGLDPDTTVEIPKKYSKSRSLVRRLDRGIEGVQGYEKGSWIIHRDIHGKGWSITNKPTGITVKRNLYTLNVAKDFLEKILDENSNYLNFKIDTEAKKKHIFMTVTRITHNYMFDLSKDE